MLAFSVSNMRTVGISSNLSDEEIYSNTMAKLSDVQARVNRQLRGPPFQRPPFQNPHVNSSSSRSSSRNTVTAPAATPARTPAQGATAKTHTELDFDTVFNSGKYPLIQIKKRVMNEKFPIEQNKQDSLRAAGGNGNATIHSWPSRYSHQNSAPGQIDCGVFMEIPFSLMSTPMSPELISLYGEPVLFSSLFDCGSYQHFFLMLLPNRALNRDSGRPSPSITLCLPRGLKLGIGEVEVNSLDMFNFNENYGVMMPVNERKCTNTRLGNSYSEANVIWTDIIRTKRGGWGEGWKLTLSLSIFK